MSRDRIIQLITPVILVLCLTASGAMLPGLMRESDENVLRYTNVSVDGAPPIVVLGTAIGALRGLIADVYWIKANAMKEKGLYFEAMADADMITKLQPRFAQVWAFHGHNMAYNISVACQTQQERWEWVNAGIRLVRNEGLRYNPNDMALHRELAFWFAHKIEGVADDAHLYYKWAFCNEWHMVLGEPPVEFNDYVAWMKKVVDAPEDLSSVENRTPGVRELLAELREVYRKNAGRELKLDRTFLQQYVQWQSVKTYSAAAKVLKIEEQYRQQNPAFDAFDKLAGDPKYAEAWDALIAHVRKRVLRDEYNMEPERMLRYAEELKTPIDWRHGQAHALYWSRKGSEMGAGRVKENDVYIVLNNDSQQMQAMQDLARSGRISFDPFSSELPGRFPDPRWIDAIDANFEPMYLKHIDVRGAGGERFITFLQNFMSSAICEWYRAGERARAKALMARLDSLFGSGATMTTKFKQDLDVFVRNETFDQYQAQPHVAPRDIWASLRYGFKMALLANRPEVLRDALDFAKTVTDWYKGNHWNDFVTKFGTSRMGDIVHDLEDSTEIGYLQMMMDPGIKLVDRMTMWANTDKVETEVFKQSPSLRALVYDRLIPGLRQQFANSEQSSSMTADQAFPAPSGLDNARARLLQRKQEREKTKEEQRARDSIERKS